MGHISYSTRLVFQSESDKQKIFAMLDKARFTWNEASKCQITLPRNDIRDLHSKFYRNFKDNNPEIPSQIVIIAQKAVLEAFRGIKSRKDKIKGPPVKKKFSIRLDKRTFSHKNGIFSIISLEKRIKCSPFIYPKLKEYLDKYEFCDPLLFVRNNEIFISLTFKIPELKAQNKLALGIDLGCRVNAATSEGKLYVDKKFNKEKRELRYLKRCLQAKSKKSKSAKRHLRKLRHKERNKNKNFTHHLANRLIHDTQADTLVLENLKSIKVKKSKYQNKNRISQVPLYELKQILTYKAPLFGKTVIQVCPSYTSQIDHRTGKKDGIRQGARYTGKDKQVLHADANAACNIALRSKLPCSISNYFAWQAIVNSPNVGVGRSQAAIPLG